MNELIVTYSVIIDKDHHDQHIPYLVAIPTLDGHTQGTSVDAALAMARDYIGLKVLDMIDDGNVIPESDSDIPKGGPDQVIEFVTVNISNYRREHAVAK